jgi:hypothetical protein
MAKKRHKKDTKEFKDETFAEQAKTSTATLNNPFNAIKHHVDHSLDRARTRRKCVDQAQRPSKCDPVICRSPFWNVTSSEWRSQLSS